MSTNGIQPRRERLRHAIDWLSEQGRHDPAALEEAARRFDLTPLEEDFLLTRFGEEVRKPDED